MAEIASIPGVSSTGSTRRPPGKTFLIGSSWVDRMPGPAELNAPASQAVYIPVSSGTFKTLGIPLKSGCDFDDRDIIGVPYAAVINEALARRSFPGKDPVGRKIAGMLMPGELMTVIGVVGDVRQSARLDPMPEIYIPYQQHPYWGMDLSIVARTVGDPGPIAKAMREMVRELAANVPVSFTTAEASLRENTGLPLLRTVLFAVFSGLATCLAIAGVYSVIAFIMGPRTGEMGLPMAPCATAEDIR